MIKKVFVIFILSILVFSYSSIYAFDSVYVWSDAVETKAEITENTLNLTCGGAVLMEQETGKVLYEHNPHEKLRPASVTKVMSLLLIMEALDSGKISLNDKVPCSENASSMGGSQIWLDVKEELTVDEMLKAICVVSANDCVVAMAEFLSGSESAFVEEMNKRAKELGMYDTTFKNCHGIDEEGHLTSAYDIALMSRELMKNHGKISEYATIWMDSLRDGKSSLVNTNKLIRTYNGITGLKTGSTSLALYNLSATATRGDLSLIAVIMIADTSVIRFDEAKKLLDYGFNNYTYKKFANVGDVAGIVQIDKGIEKSVEGIYSANSGSLIKKGQEKNIEQQINLSDYILAPVKKGDILGKVIYKVEDEILGVTDIVAKKDVNKISLGNSLLFLYSKWFKLLRE